MPNRPRLSPRTLGRTLAAALATGLLAAAVSVVVAVPSSAQAPYTATGTLEKAAVPIGVTDSEFFTVTCPEPPSTQGQDAWVFDLPAEVRAAGTHVQVTADPADYLIHAFLYEDDCSFTREVDGTAGAGVATDLAAGERFVVVYTTTVGLDVVGLTLTATPGSEPTPTGSPTATPTTGSPTPTPTPTGGTRGTYPETPDDPLFLQNGADDLLLAGQWGMRTIRAPQAWQQPRATGAGITVAVIDSGLDLGHEDFACPGKVVVVPGSDPDPDGKDLPTDDDEGHGTHVAGIVGACTDNGTGVVGVAPDARIMPIQGLSPTVTDTVGTLAGAIDTAVANGAHVINMSLGFGLTGHVGTAAYLTGETYAPIERAIERAAAAGVVVVAAAGNDTSPLCGFPAIAEDVVCVGSSDKRDVNSWFGNFPFKGDVPSPALLAPGGAGEPAFCDFSAEDVISTYAVAVDDSEGDCDGLRGYATIEGTSMASPHVAGVAALVYDRIGGQRSGPNGAKVVEAILGSAVDLYGPGYDPASGYGRLDALGAVTYFEPAPEPTVTPTPTAQPTSVALLGAPASGQFSDSVALSARLTDTGGHALAGEPLTFQLLGRDGFREVSATTGADGTASATLALDAPPGSYDVIAAYAGKAGTWQTSRASSAFAITREDTATALTVSGGGSKRTLSASVADADSGTGVAGVVVTFWDGLTKLGEAVTGEGGTATFTAPPGARGSSASYRAEFAGNALFLPSRSG